MISAFSPSLALLILLVAQSTILSSSFIVAPSNLQLLSSNVSANISSSRTTTLPPLYMSTVIKPPETETERRTKKRGDNLGIPTDEGNIRGPIEWLIDDPLVSREIDDPFHILLIDETFTQNSRITIPYVASSCAYVLGMPYDEAAELAAHAEKEGFSCLGTWGHEECVRLGRQLQNRDVICRVVPYCEGGDRPWQARNAREDDQVVGGGGGDGARWA
jgi:hypothetical protein